MRAYFIYCKLAIKRDCLYIISSWNDTPPKGYYPISLIHANTKADALLKCVPKKFLTPESELHAQLNLFNKRRIITHHVYSKLSKRADCIHIIFTASFISIKDYHHICSLNAFSISDALNQFIPKMFLKPSDEVLAYLKSPFKYRFPNDIIP
jgi:hypothetical protein